MRPMSESETTAGRPPGIDRAVEAAGTSAGELSIDEVCHILQNGRRRNALQFLREADEVVRMGDLAEAVAAWENETTVDRLRCEQRKRVYIALHQVHLPKLDEAGVVDYDSDRGTISLLPAARPLYDAIDALSPDVRDASPGRIHAFLTGAGVVAGLALWITMAGSAAPGLLIGVALLVTGTLWTVSTRRPIDRIRSHASPRT